MTAERTAQDEDWLYLKSQLVTISRYNVRGNLRNDPWLKVLAVHIDGKR